MSETPALTLSQLNGRFRLLDGPVALPGKCVVCGCVKGQFIDIGLDVEFYGAVIFCVPCMIAVAEIIDLVPAEKLREAEAKYETAVENITQVESVLDEYIASSDTLHAAFIDSLRGVSSGTVTINKTVLTKPEREAEPVTEQVPDFVIDEGPVSVPSSSSDGEPGIFNF